MIRLDIREYCHNCPDFFVDSETHMHYSSLGETGFDTFLRCKHRERCQRIEKYLTNKIKEETK